MFDAGASKLARFSNVGKSKNLVFHVGQLKYLVFLCREIKESLLGMSEGRDFSMIPTWRTTKIQAEERSCKI